MNKTSIVEPDKSTRFSSPVLGVLQRKCACGTHAMAGGECTECTKKKSGLQRKLVIGASNDPLEEEADRIADQVMAAPVHAHANATPPRIQRFTGHAASQMEAAPASVDHVLASSGRPLEISLQRDMGQRFGYDFSRVRVHTGAAAEQSARDVNAHAYTVGNSIVFGHGQFAPGMRAGQRLLAHELVHTIQQGQSVGDSSEATPQIQRTIGDGHDLQAPRFSGNVQLEAAFDNELLIAQPGKGNISAGLAVRLIQQSLIDQGYTLPGFGVDGIFGPETEAAIKRFQTDAGAVLIDGIVGPETMGLLDQHDTTFLTGVGPVQITGPVPGPRPAPAAGCDRPFTGVTFTLANQVAAGVNPAATIGIARRGGRDALVMQGTAPANYNPDITINAPNDARAREFQVGFVSNILTDLNVYNFSNGAAIRAVLPTPMKDGVALSSGNYDPVYVTGPSLNILETFTGNSATVHLNWPDTPSDMAFVNLLDNPQCGAPLTAAVLTDNRMQDTFRTWVAARHVPTGCVVPLHHIDWNLDWSARILNLGILGVFAIVTGSAINVTQPNGDGSPRFIQGGQVPDDFVSAGTDRVCA